MYVYVVTYNYFNYAIKIYGWLLIFLAVCNIAATGHRVAVQNIPLCVQEYKFREYLVPTLKHKYENLLHINKLCM